MFTTDRPLRIAHVVSGDETVPPEGYGGIERMVDELAKRMVQLGHHVTLFASGDSRLEGVRLFPICEQPIRTLPGAEDPRRRQDMIHAALGKAAVELAASDFDIIHNHSGWWTLGHLKKAGVQTRCITTIHGPLEDDTERNGYRTFAGMPGMHFVSISNAQREGAPELPYAATVYNGIDTTRTGFNPRRRSIEDPLLFLGRVCADKGTHLAVEAAQGSRLIIAGKVDPTDKEYYKTRVQPFIDGEWVEYIGEVNDAQKYPLLGSAGALIMPNQFRSKRTPKVWREPFGLTAIEAMSTGTPVVAVNDGALPELIIHSKTGFLCNTEAELRKYIRQVGDIDPQDCRSHVENNFTADHMTNGYMQVYEAILSGNYN